jgi:hypothetical protein
LTPAVAAAPAGGAIEVRVRAAHGGTAADILARPLPPLHAVSDALSAFDAAVSAAYCAKWGRPLAGAHLTSPIDPRGLLELAAGVVRSAAHAEVMIVNSGAVNSALRLTAPEELSAGDVFEALPYDEPIDVASVSGEWLKTRAREASEKRLAVIGVSPDGTEVNGRPLLPRGSYRSRRFASSQRAAMPRCRRVPHGPKFPASRSARPPWTSSPVRAPSIPATRCPIRPVLSSGRSVPISMASCRHRRSPTPAGIRRRRCNGVIPRTLARR